MARRLRYFKEQVGKENLPTKRKHRYSVGSQALHMTIRLRLARSQLSAPAPCHVHAADRQVAYAHHRSLYTGWQRAQHG